MNAEENTLMALLGYVYLQNTRPDKAAAVLAALDKLAPNQPKVLRALSLALIRSGKAQRALDTLDGLAMAGGSDAVFHLLRSQALQLLERHEESASAMQSYVHLRGLLPPTSGHVIPND